MENGAPEYETRVITEHWRRRCVPAVSPYAERGLYWRIVSSHMVVNALEK